MVFLLFRAKESRLYAALLLLFDKLYTICYIEVVTTSFKKSTNFEQVKERCKQ